MQIGGWLLYAVVQIVSSIIATGGTSSDRIIFLFFESLLCLLVTHLARIALRPGAWLNIGIPRLIIRVLFTALLLGVILYFLRMPISYLLGIYEKDVIFDRERIWGLCSSRWRCTTR